MSSLSNIPKQSYFSAQLQSPIDSSQTTGIILTDTPDFTPAGETIYFNILDSGRVETISATGWSSNVLSGVTRNVATYSGETAVGYAHAAGVTVVLSDDWNYFAAIQTAVNSKFDTAGGTITGAVAFSGASTTFKIPNLTEAERDALTPANGMILYNTTAGEFQYYDGGAWNAVGTSSVPNGTDTVAGVWEGATVAEQGTQSATGGTGAGLVLQPKNLVKTSSGAGDENKIAILEASGAYADGFLNAATNGASKTLKTKADGKIDDSVVALTTAGDTMYSDGTDLQRVAIGSNGQVYTSNGTAPTWTDPSFGKEVIDPDGFSYTNSAAEQTIFSESIAGGVLGTNNGVEFKIYVSDFNSNGSSVPYIFRLKYGSTTIATISNTTITSAGSKVGIIEGVLMANGATNAQTGVLVVNLRTASFAFTGTGEPGGHQLASGSATEDSTGALNLIVTVEIQSSSADFSSVGSYVRVIK